MELSSDLIREFAKNTNDKPVANVGATVYGTFRIQEDGLSFVQVDGSDTRTPVASTVECKNGDRVTVLIKDHRAIVTGNLEDPSVSTSTVEEIKKNLNLGFDKVDETIGGIQKDMNELYQDIEVKYTDIEGNIQTINTTIGNISSQITGMASSIDGAAKVATNYISFEEPYGLIIGDLVESTLGFNVLIDATSVNMRYNSTTLAKYASDVIYLGYNSYSSKIDLCDNKGLIKTEYDSSGKYYDYLLSLISDDGIRIGCKGGRELYGTDVPYPFMEMYKTDGMGIPDTINFATQMLSLNGSPILTYGSLSNYGGDIKTTGSVTFGSLDESNEVAGYSSYKLVAVGSTGTLHRTSISLKDIADGKMKVVATFG